MISAASRPYIDASVAVLREHGVAITTTFYRKLFAAHPDLGNLFNMGNQASPVEEVLSELLAVKDMVRKVLDKL